MRVLFLLIALAVTATEGYSQSNAGLPSPLDRTLSQIREERPALSTGILNEDLEAVGAAMPAIWHIFKKRNLSYDDAYMATLDGWLHLRLGKLSPQSTLSPKDLINLVAEHVRFTIKTNPSGADVELDGTKLPRRTVTAAWCTPGTHRVRIKKEGYQPMEATCEVKSDPPSECIINLIPVGKPNQ
jgi:hypothetical protein